MLRGIVILLFITSTQFVSITLHAQTEITSCLYVGEKDNYVLSEKFRLDNGQFQTFNSLFIWDKDKVIRIVFLYDRKFSVLSPRITNQLKSFKSFLPTFKVPIWHEHYQRHNNKIIYTIAFYDQTFTDGNEDDIRGDDYANKFKALIDARNKKRNPLADKFGKTNVIDGDPEVMIYNEKRKGKEINNFPLLINSAKGDSSYIISPIYINVYRIDRPAQNTASILKNFTEYKLYSTISFIQQSVRFPTGETIDEPYKWPLENVISRSALPSLYKAKLAIDTSSLINELSDLPLSDKKAYLNVIHTYELQPIGNTIQSKKDSIRNLEYTNNRRKDSVKWREAVKLNFLKGDGFLYQYCAECYNNETSKNEKIRWHCPFKIDLDKNGSDKNWSYAFSDKNRHYFKVEERFQNRRDHFVSNQDDIDLLNSQKWLLVSPGIGYWMTDVSNYYSQYKANFENLYLNGKRIVE